MPREQLGQQKMLDKVLILLAFSLGLFLFVASMRFILKVVEAKTDFSTFNYSLSLRLLVSGIGRFSYLS